MGRKRKGLSSKEDVLNAQELAMLIGACRGIRDSFIISCLTFCGLRVSELAHLKRSWVNIEDATITIPERQYCSCWECNYVNPKTGKCKEGIWKPKTKKGARTVLMGSKILPIINQFLLGSDGLNLTRQRIWQRVKELAKDARILHNVYPHCLRATAATRLAYKNISAASLKYVMGWEKLEAADAYVKSDMKLAHKEIREIESKDLTADT